MEVEIIKADSEELQAQAKKDWKQYCQTLREKAVDNREYMKHYKRLKNALYYLSKGKMILDLEDSMRKAGLNDQDLPRLAIAPADAKHCRARWNWNDIEFEYGLGWNRRLTYPASLFGVPDNKRHTSNYLESVIPKIPAQYYPSNLSKYFILWEVDEWQKIPVPPKDPMLLKPLGRNRRLFVVVAHWDLTPLERMILKEAVS